MSEISLFTLLNGKLTTIKQLSVGAHEKPEDGMCAIEAASVLAGEPFSDHPQSVCPVIGSFVRPFNDLQPDHLRQELIWWIPRLVGTRASQKVERKRSYLLVDTTLRDFLPEALWFLGHYSEAWRLRRLHPITSTKTSRQAYRQLKNSESAWYGQPSHSSVEAGLIRAAYFPLTFAGDTAAATLKYLADITEDERYWNAGYELLRELINTK